MQRDEVGSHSIAMDTNIMHRGLIPLGVSDSQPQNHFVPGLFPPPWTLGEAMNHNYLCAQVTNNTIAVANSDEYWNAQPMRGIRDFTPGTPYAQISSTRASDHIVDAITDNYSSNPTSSSLNHGFESLPFSSSSRWDFNHFGTAIHDQCSDMSSSGPTSYSLHKSQSGHASSSSSNHSLSFDSHNKPLQISSLLSGSKKFHAMQEILAEIACYALENFDGTFYSSTGINIEGVDQERVVEAKKKKNLLALLQVVDERYNQCLDEIHTVISAFHAVTELDPNLHARFALPTISFMYKNLRERISAHILAMGSHLGTGDDSSRAEDNSLETCFLQKQWALQQLRKRSDHQLWRPQRGLPERSVSVLRAWMFQNFLHPYPKDADKHLLALKSGLTRSQVSNWFINARVRLWKPMIEEMYAEMNRRKARRTDEEDGIHLRNHMRFENGRFTMD